MVQFMKPKKAKMLFHGFGCVSEETWPVLSETAQTITLHTDDEKSKCKQFNKKTGKCLNDTTDFGCWRTLKLK